MILVLILKFVTGLLTLEDSVELELVTSQTSGSNFESSVESNGITYYSICDCTNIELVEDQKIKCAPSQITLTQEIENEGASLEDVQNKLESTNYTFADVLSSSFRCIDGRITSESLGAFGGDLGEFGLALLVYEDLSGQRVDESSVKIYLSEYLGCMEQSNFYMCNDDQATSSVEQELGITGVDFYNPKEDLQDDLLELLTQPDGVGDLHLKYLLKYPDKYSIRPEAISILIKVFYKLL